MRRTLFLMFLIFLAGCGPSSMPLEEVLRTAEDAAASGQTEQAISVLEANRETYPNSPRLLESLAFAYSQAGQTRAAAEAFLSTAELSSDDAYLLYAAQAFRDAGDAQQAIAAYRNYLDRTPDDAGTTALLARLLEEQGRTEEALNAYLAAHRIRPSGPVALAIGRLYAQRGNAPQARVWYQTALSYDDVAAKSLLGLLEIALQSERFSRAEELVARLDEDFPGELEVSRLANVRGELEEWRQREAEFRQAQARIAQQQQQSEANAQTPAEPEPEPESAPEPQPEESQPVVVESEPAPEPVEEEEPAAPQPSRPERVVPPKPLVGSPLDSGAGSATQPEPTSEPATQETQTRRPSQAASNAAPQTSSLPANATLVELLQSGNAALTEGRYAEAERYFKRILSRESNPPAIWFKLSEAHYEQGEYRWAAATAQEAYRRDRDNPEYAIQRLKALQHTLEPRQFLLEVESARREFPEVHELTLALARGYRDLEGNRALARQLYNEFLEAVPDHPDAAKARSERDAL